MYLAFFLSLLVIALGVVVFLVYDQYQRLGNKRRGFQLISQDIEDEKGPVILEEFEPEDRVEVLEVPEELLNLFGLSQDRSDAKGLIETAFGNFVERKKLKSETKTSKVRQDYKKQVLEEDKLDTSLIEARIQKLKTQFEAGLINQRQLDSLRKHFPDIYDMVTEAKEMRKLKHLVEMLELEAKAAELKLRASKDGLEKYREHWQRVKNKLIADIEGRHNLRTAFFDKIEELAYQMKQDGRSETEINIFKEQLRRDVEQFIMNLREETE